MKLDQKTFNVLIPSEKLAGIAFWRANFFVGRSYCGPMGVHSLCPGLCVECQARLLKAFDLTQAKNPEALLTYNLKLAVAKAKEERSAAKPEPKPETSLFPVSEGLFERIARETASPPR